MRATLDEHFAFGAPLRGLKSASLEALSPAQRDAP